MTSNASVLATSDLDFNGKADVILAFPGYGVWIFMNNDGFVQLHPYDAEGIVAGRFDAS